MGNGTITMTGAEYDALAGKIATLEAENANLRAELERRVPAGFVLVPVEPTPEMVSAAEEAYMPFGDMDIALRMAILAAPSAPATVQGDGWIPVSERLPESERTVLAFYLNSHGKGRRVRAEYVAAKTKSADDGWDSDEPADYDEQADEYFWPAGWYEVMDNWDDLTHMVIHEGGVTHWMSLPAAPGAAPSAPKADDPVKQMLLEALEGMVEYFPEGSSDGECFSVDAAHAAIAAARQGGR